MSVKFQHGRDEVIAAAIVLRGLGTDPTPWENWVPDKGIDPPDSSWPVGNGSEAPHPDNCITVYEAEPQVDAKIQLTGELQTHWGITVRVRGGTYKLAQQKAEDIRWDFNEQLYQQQVTLDGLQYLVFAVTRAVPTRPMLLTPTSTRWFVNLNCLAVIQAYPIGG